MLFTNLFCYYQNILNWKEHFATKNGGNKKTRMNINEKMTVKEIKKNSEMKEKGSK